MAIPIYQFYCDGFWNSYDELASKQIAEANAAKLDSIILTEGVFRPGTQLHEVYEVLPSLNLQRNLYTGTCRQIRRLNATIHGWNPVPDFDTPTQEVEEFLIPVAFRELPDPMIECNICLGTFTDEPGLVNDDSSDTLTAAAGNPPQANNEQAKPVKLPRCVGHYFHADCISEWLAEKHQCPYCKAIYGCITGSCPPGEMEVRHTSEKLPGYDATSNLNTTKKSNGTWIMQWHIESGIQGPKHPSPGKWFHGTTRVGFIPDTPEFRKVLKMLMIAWQRKLMFNVGYSLTRNVHDVVCWSGIHIRTEWEDHYGFGWPCPEYLTSVIEELKHRGITEESELD